jgi:hypothetical protein
MSKQISREQTPTGAFRRPLFQPCALPADDTDEHITFDVSPLLEACADKEAPPSAGSRSRLVVLGLVSVSSVAAMAVLMALLAGTYTMNRSGETAPQTTGAEGEPVDVIRD